MKIAIKEHFMSSVLYLSSGVFLLVLLYLGVDSTVWVDEAYTMGIVEYSIPDLIYVTAQDVHPPLYYIIVKLVLSFLRIEDIYVRVIFARMVSILPCVGVWVLCFTYIRKNFGELTGSLFSLYFMTAPQMIANALEIRMYNWACFFILIAFLTVYRLIVLQKKDVYCYVVLGSAVLCAFYTHYFAAIAAALILLICFAMILMSDKKQILPFLVMCALDALLYFPWFVVAFGQIKDVGQDYWIAPVDKSALIRYFWYTFRIDDSLFATIIGILLIIVSLKGLVATIYNRKQKEYLLAFGAMMIMPLTVLAGVIASFLFRPVFVERYMIPTFGCFWLGLAYLISVFDKKKYLWIAISVLFIGMGVKQYSVNINQVRENRVEMKEARELFENLDQDDVIVHSSLNTEIPTAYYCQNSVQYMMKETSTLKIDQIIFDNVENEMDPEGIKKILEKKTVWCFIYPNEEILDEEWKMMLAEGKYRGEYKLDWCKFQVYSWN